MPENIVDKLMKRCEELAVDKANAVFLLRQLRDSKTTWLDEEQLRMSVDSFLRKNEWYCERCMQIVSGQNVTFSEHHENCGCSCSGA